MSFSYSKNSSAWLLALLRHGTPGAEIGGIFPKPRSRELSVEPRALITLVIPRTPPLGQLRRSKVPVCLSVLNLQRYKTKTAKDVAYLIKIFLEVKNFNDADSNGSPWLH
ncbi:hypothetical protein M9H77_05074 [Catharanthus roseus]|uniref:Uncharacterized protein n=1 Tax=Catharanthus roseus TaxID=4058 RepID=A0ACC0CGG2_CATRO|nr:hypothetical protein M9H77_05074 [Catharanthus roseus]